MALPLHERQATSPGRNPSFKPVPLRSATRHSIDLEDYFAGPRDMKHHSKWPFFFRIHGSVLPRIIVPLIIVSAWSSLITWLCFRYQLTVNSVLLTVLGFVVGLGLSFRSTTAYERYIEGARYFATLQLSCRNLARLIWIHANERHSESAELGKADLLAKLTAINLINGFAIALKHRLRFEIAPDYPDLAPYITVLNTMVSNADTASLHPPPRNVFKRTGEFLGVSFAESNPRKQMKRATDNLGNIPHEILSYLQAFIEHLNESGTCTNGPIQSNMIAQLAIMADVATGTERIVNHPLPLAYSISIAQITWVYVMVLPFQLYAPLKWVAIPGTIFAAYIILGLGAIGAEIENPFGNDVNDLPLDQYCRELSGDLDVLTSISRSERTWNTRVGAQWLQHPSNKVLWPLSASGWDDWHEKPVEEIREALWEKAVSAKGIRRGMAAGKSQREEEMRVQRTMTARSMAGGARGRSGDSGGAVGEKDVVGTAVRGRGSVSDTTATTTTEEERKEKERDAAATVTGHDAC